MRRFCYILATVLLAAGCTRKAVVPEETVPISRGAYKHVVIIGVDGGGAFFKDAATPCCDAIFADGAVTYRSRAVDPTISAQNWGAILHGVLPEFHRLTNQVVDTRPFPVDSPFPSVFRVAREAWPAAKLASFCNWNPINYGIIENNLGVVEGTGNDQAVTEMALQYLDENAPTLLFIQFDSVDGAGHGNGYGSEAHLRALSVVDALIGQVYGKLREKGLLEDTLFIVTADHGGTPEGSHGGDSDAERYIFLGVAGKTVDGKTGITFSENRDVAAIAAYALGLDFPEMWTGHVPTGVFPGVEAGERKVVELPVSEDRKHRTEPTPALSEMQELLQGHTVLAYLPFDGDERDAFDRLKPSAVHKLYYYDAYFGKGVALDDGYVSLEGVSVGRESFSAACWIKTVGVTSDPAILSNKDWKSGYNDGFVFSLREDDIKFNAGSRSANVRMDMAASLPYDYAEGWMHVALVVDRGKNKVRIYEDFTLGAEADIPASLQSVSFDALTLNIGQDGTGAYSDKLPAQLDEFILVADVLDEADIAALKAYYR